MNKALIFDCDGVLGDTERHGHLPAFNQMWREFGVPWQWTVGQYGEKLKISGGKERMAALFTEPDFLRAFTPPADEIKRRELLASWHSRKTAIFQKTVASHRIPPRPGVKRLTEEALARGWKLAVASTSAQAAVEAMLRHAVGEETFYHFSAVLAGDIVENKKPAPDIYQLAARRLSVAPESCVVIEDSPNGAAAAAAAGMRCVVTVSGYTRAQDFPSASLVLTSLGDPAGESSEIIANRSLARPRRCLAVGDLEVLLRSHGNFLI